MQTLPNQILLGPAEMISLLSEVFILVDMSGTQKSFCF